MRWENESKKIEPREPCAPRSCIERRTRTKRAATLQSSSGREAHKSPGFTFGRRSRPVHAAVWFRGQFGIRGSRRN